MAAILVYVSDICCLERLFDEPNCAAGRAAVMEASARAMMERILTVFGQNMFERE
jgi:hypothetical protein